MKGVSIHDEVDGCAKGAFLHHSTSDWEVTSDSPIESVCDGAVLTKELPGRLGAYVYPWNAVFTLKNKTQTSLQDYYNSCHSETVIVTERHHMNHISVEVTETTVQSDNECEDEEEEEDDDDNVNECVIEPFPDDDDVDLNISV